ncbi:MAG: type III pantothenate kinase [Spirochaetaceae bacterium]|jgi:type III pantothenate kinase|nr:type III pantothenate kinase [Spirochaetaceae bacterium]
MENQALLVIDIGNSTIASAIFYGDADDASGGGRQLPPPELLEPLPTGTALAAEDQTAIFRSFFESRLDNRGVRAAILSSVVPRLTESCLNAFEELLGKRPLLVNSGIYHFLPVKIPVSRARQIGTDFVCNAVEAYLRFKRPCVITDFGTALTFAAISPSGELMGTAIAPGIAAASKALADNAAQLYSVPFDIPPSPLGENTVQAMQSGLIYGWAGLAESLVSRFKSEICCRTDARPQDIQVIATGGFCDLIAPLAGITCMDRHLVLYGLRSIANLAARFFSF